MLPNVGQVLLRLKRFEVPQRKGRKRMKISQFVKESYAELKKVIWPNKDEVVNSVKVVVVSTIIVAAILGLIDMLLLMGIRAVF
jgi:preprotein translocase subunit SecE